MWSSSSQRLGEITLLPTTAPAIAKALDVIGDDSAFGAACASYWSGSSVLRDALLPYLLRKAEGHEAELGKLAREGEVEHALAALARLVAVGTPAGKAAIHEAFRSAHLELRKAAITYLPDVSADTMRAELVKVFEDPEPEVRVRALGAVSELGAVAAGPVLVRRIQSAELSALPAAERRLLLQTLARLNPRRGEAIAIELLVKTQLVPTQAAEETRAIAAEVLGETSSGEALEALKNAAKKRWWNTAAVRDAAAAAALAVGARRGVVVKEES